MALTVEDGTGLSNAESYVSVAAFKSYADARGIVYSSYSDAQIEQALRRATEWIDATFGGRFQGVRTVQTQALSWPRKAGEYSYGIFIPGAISTITNSDGVPISVNAIPAEIVRATCEATSRELAAPNSLAPDLERGGAVKKLKAGSVEVEYADGAAVTTAYSAISNALASLIGQTPTGGAVNGAVQFSTSVRI